MRISRHRRNYQAKVEEPRFRVNEQIAVPQVRVIAEDGSNLDVMNTADAIALAHERGYDVVEISPKLEPPVVKFLNFTQFKYEKQKEARVQKAHAKKVDVKGIRLSARIGAHDLLVRRNQALEFLKNGNKVQLEIVLRGRERQHVDIGEKVMREFYEGLKPEIGIKLEQPFGKQGGRLTMLISRT